MLSKVPSFKTSDNQTFEQLEAAQKHELALLFQPTDASGRMSVIEVVDTIVEKSDEITDVLTTTPSSLLKARSNRGGKKPRKAKAAPATAA